MSDLTPEMTQSLLNFFRTLIDTERLQIAGLLARQPHTAEQLAEQLKLKPAAVSRQLEKLVEAGLVRTEAKVTGTRYSLQLEAAHALAAQLAARSGPPALDENLEAFERQVLSNYLLADGAIKELPAQEKKFLVILRYVFSHIEQTRRYTEKELNALLFHFHSDVATLRRAMVDLHWLERTVTGSEYWRAA